MNEVALVMTRIELLGNRQADQGPEGLTAKPRSYLGQLV
jgi:hypothetical protein